LAERPLGPAGLPAERPSQRPLPSRRGRPGELVERKLTVLGGLLQLDQVALRVAAVDRFDMAHIDGTWLAERHAQSLEALVLLLDVRDVDAEMRVALVVRLQRRDYVRRGLAVFEQLHVAGARTQHRPP